MWLFLVPTLWSLYRSASYHGYYGKWRIVNVDHMHWPWLAIYHGMAHFVILIVSCMLVVPSNLNTIYMLLAGNFSLQKVVSKEFERTTKIFISLFCVFIILYHSSIFTRSHCFIVHNYSGSAEWILSRTSLNFECF